MELPVVGQKISVVVRNHSPARTNPELRASIPETDTLCGRVIQNPQWVSSLKGGLNFCMTLDNEPYPDRNPYRVIALSNVVSIDGLEVSSSSKEESEDVLSFDIQGSKKGTSYTVIVRSKMAVCTCPGFTFHGKCKHINKALEKMIEDELKYDK